jgi:serine/threonine protein kinase
MIGMTRNLDPKNNNRLAVMETRACAECGASLPSGVSDVFCPACALRGALVGGSQPGEGTRSLRWFHRLIRRKQDDKSHNKNLASAGNEWRKSLPMTTVAPAPGELIGDYEILERIGGNMGLVFEARHRRLDKVVALKLVPADSIADPARLARFQREMRVMGQLKHPNLVPAEDARAEGDWHLVTMELIDGVDLYQLVKGQGALPVAAACEAARQAAQGLQYAHEHGMIHRDIKPSNLMLTRAGTIKVIDMGLALIGDESSAQLTRSGQLMGTMSYCAPEQFQNASSVDIRADIYSLGCTLYHLLTGKSPYSQRKTVNEIVQAHLHEPFPNLTEALPNAPTGLGGVLARMTAKDRDARYSTPAEVAKALETFAGGADLASLVPAKTKTDHSPAGRVTPPPPLQGRRTTEGEGASRRPKSPWPAVAASLAVLLVIAVAMILSRTPTEKNAQMNLTSLDRAVFLMDTTAPMGIYDTNNIGTGRSNADELYKELAGFDGILSSDLFKEGIGLDWARDSFVAAHRPRIVIIHRSSFFHPVAAHLKLDYPPFDNDADGVKLKTWQAIYDAQDARLRSFIRLVGAVVPHTQFLVYSTGTDKNWLRPEFRTNWAKTLEMELPQPPPEGRINTMVISKQPDGQKGTFRDAKTMEEIRRHVREMNEKLRKREPKKLN